MDELPAVLTIAEFARIFRVHRTTVEEWCERGEVKSFRTPGGSRRLPIDVVIAKMREMGFDERSAMSVLRAVTTVRRPRG